MSQRTRFAGLSAIAATFGGGILALLFGASLAEIAMFVVLTALLGTLWVVLLAHARVRPGVVDSEGADDTQITAMIGADVASSIHGDGSHHSGGHHGPMI